MHIKHLAQSLRPSENSLSTCHGSFQSLFFFMVDSTSSFLILSAQLQALNIVRSAEQMLTTSQSVSHLLFCVIVAPLPE